MTTDTKTQILYVAEELTKQRGFDGFSYRDVSAAVGVKTSSIHYYYPTKGDLAEALIERYVNRFVAVLTRLSNEPLDGFGRVKKLFEILVDVSGRQKNLCLCGMLSADVYGVTTRAKTMLDGFFSRFEEWLSGTIQQGIVDGSIHRDLRSKSLAAEIVALVEGGMLLARVRLNTGYYEDLLAGQLAKLRA